LPATTFVSNPDHNHPDHSSSVTVLVSEADRLWTTDGHVCRSETQSRVLECGFVRREIDDWRHAACGASKPAVAGRAAGFLRGAFVLGDEPVE